MKGPPPPPPPQLEIMVSPLQNKHNLKSKLILKTQKTGSRLSQTQQKKGITFTYYSPLIHKVTNLFRNTVLGIAFRTRNNIYS
jgi:hypothetical protein